MEPLNKFAAGELPLSPTLDHSLHKKSKRHHVKRRSSGRIHAVAPLTRATTTEEPCEPIQPSSYCFSMNEPYGKDLSVSGGFTMTTPSMTDSPPITPTDTSRVLPAMITSPISHHPSTTGLGKQTLHLTFIDRHPTEDLAQILTTLNKEYRSLQTYHDPMYASLKRCLGHTLFLSPTSRQRHQRLLQLQTEEPEHGWNAFLDRMFYKT